MTRPIEFVIDIVSPNAYVAWRVLPAMAAEAGVALTYTPALLGGIFKETGNAPPLMNFSAVKGKVAYIQKEFVRFLKKHRLREFKWNDAFPVNSALAMRAMLAAEDEGRIEAYIAATMKGMWEDNRNLGDPDTLRDVLAAAGFDADAYIEKGQSGEMKERLFANTKAAVERGVFGMPSFFIGDEMYYGKETLADVIAEATG